MYGECMENFSRAAKQALGKIFDRATGSGQVILHTFFFQPPLIGLAQRYIGVPGYAEHKNVWRLPLNLNTRRDNHETNLG